MSKKNICFIYACDLENYRGEGTLGLDFINDISTFHPDIIFNCFSPNLKFKIKKNKIYSLKRKKKNRFINFNFYSEYFYPIYGIFVLWYYYFTKKKIIYLNFLPLWNIFLFLLLPPGTRFGPITGYKYNGKIRNLSTFLRKLLFPFLFKFSLFFLNIRQGQFLFSSDLLKDFLSQKNLNKSIFYYQARKIKHLNYRVNKIYDFVIYYRNYFGKNNDFIVKTVKTLSKNNFKVAVFGNYLNIPNIKNFGLIKKSKVLEILKRSKYTIVSPENFYSMFFIDCYNLNVKIFYHYKSRPKKLFVNKNIIEINFNKFDLSIKKINQELNKRFIFHNEKKFFLKKFMIFKKKQDLFLKSIF